MTITIDMDKRLRNVVLALVAVTSVAFGAVACSGTSQPSGQAKENAAQNAITATIVNNQPLPHFNWSQYRQTMIDVETIEAQGTATTTFFFNQGVADPTDSCPIDGLPIPNTASLSNPQQVVDGSNGGSGYGLTTIGQMDPNGVYTPPSSSGTAVICVDSSGRKYVNYWEGFVKTVTVPAVWNYTTHRLEVTGAPTFTVGSKPPSVRG